MAVRTLRRGLGAAAAAAVLWLWLCPGMGLASAAVHRRGAAITSTAAFDRTLSKDLGEPGGASSALVLDTSTGQILFSDKADTARLPASVEKLFTTSAALFEFGSNFRFQTGVYGVGSLSHGVFTGTLYLKGGGDPTFGDQRFDAEFYGTGASVQSLLSNLHAAGIHEIKGAIVGDASIFDTLEGGPDSGYRASTETEGALSGLSYDAGWTDSHEVDLQPDPALWATRAFAAVAPSRGIRIARGTKVSTGLTPTDAKLLAHVASPTLARLAALTNAPSDNFFAETLDKDLGRYWGAGGSTGDGAAVIRRLISTRLGLSERTDDGSGLSRYDRTTATTVVALLEEMQTSPAFDNSLAVAGRSGTMVDEMLDTPAANNCRGKTGTLHDVANLVGYCTAANGDHLVFAFLENSLVDSTFGHETEDLMGEALADYDGSGSGLGAAPALPDPDAGSAVPSTSAGSSAPTSASSPGTTPPAGGGAGL